MHTVFSLGVSAAIYFKISVDDFEGVEVSYSLQHLPHHIAGVPLGVISLIQDPVEHLPACGTGWMRNTRHLLMTGLKKTITRPAIMHHFFFFFSGERGGGEEG